MNTAIRIDGLTKRYKDITAVDALSLDIRQGEIFALLGVNGAGKTTTVKMLTTLTKPDAGDATLIGHSIVREADAVRRVIGVSPQETAIAPNLSVRENLAFLSGVYGLHGTKAEAKIRTLSEQFSLGDVLARKAGKLSGGWQRRLSIALAMIGEPQILFLDEPTLGLDVLARSELHDILRTLRGSVTVVLTTHYMEEAESLSDRIGVMRNGSLLAVGTANELKAQTGKTTLEEAFIAIVKTGKGDAL